MIARCPLIAAQLKCRCPRPQFVQLRTQRWRESAPRMQAVRGHHFVGRRLQSSRPRVGVIHGQHEMQWEARRGEEEVSDRCKESSGSDDDMNQSRKYFHEREGCSCSPNMQLKRQGKYAYRANQDHGKHALPFVSCRVDKLGQPP